MELRALCSQQLCETAREWGAWSMQAGTGQLLWSGLHHPAASPLVLYNGFVPVKIDSLLLMCKYEWSTDIIRLYIASLC